MAQSLLNRLRDTPLGAQIRLNLRWRRALKRKKKYTNEQFVTLQFLRRMSRPLDLRNPVSFNEKLQWIKLYYNDPLYALCTDKYSVRRYIASKGHADILNELYGVYMKAEDIPLDTLPDKFIIKANHGCGWNLICKDKAELAKHWKRHCKMMNSWLRIDYSLYGRELHYAHIPPRLIVEKFLEEENGGEIKDYKFFCFDGEPKVIQVNYNSNQRQEQTRSYHDVDWNTLTVNKKGVATMETPDPRPSQLELMLDICRDLSADFPHVRVDLYLVTGKIFLGEMTLSNVSGFCNFEPESFDYDLGAMFTLPDKSSPFVLQIE